MQNKSTVDRRKQLIQFIHIGKGKLGMDNDTYRTFLLNTVGKESCSQMTVKELETALDGMKIRGFKVRSGRLPNGKRKSPPSAATVKSNIIKKIRALWLEMHAAGIIRDSSETALNHFVGKIAKNRDGHPILAVAWLDNEQATKVLERLKKWREREFMANGNRGKL